MRTNYTIGTDRERRVQRRADQLLPNAPVWSRAHHEAMDQARREVEAEMAAEAEVAA